MYGSNHSLRGIRKRYHSYSSVMSNTNWICWVNNYWYVFEIFHSCILSLKIIFVSDIWPEETQVHPAVNIISTGDFPSLLIPHGSYVLSKVLTKNETYSPAKHTVDWYRSAVISSDNTDTNYIFAAEPSCQNLPDYDQNLFEISYYTHLEVLPTYTEIK